MDTTYLKKFRKQAKETIFARAISHEEFSIFRKNGETVEVLTTDLGFSPDLNTYKKRIFKSWELHSASFELRVRRRYYIEQLLKEERKRRLDVEVSKL